jgi:hypothetical protein
MGKEKEKQVADFYAIFPHPEHARIWMLRAGEKWVLPHIRTDEEVWFAEYHKVREKLGKVLGFQVIPLRYIRNHRDCDPPRIEVIYVLEPSVDKIPATEGHWVGREVLDALGVSEHKNALKAYLEEVEKGDIPALRPPWTQSGWFDAATEWIEAQVENLGFKLTEPVECVKSWGISCVLKAHSTGGDFYLKESSTLPLFADEPALTACLATLFPNHIPKPVAIDRERHWMLLEDFGQLEVEDQEAMYRCFGELQVKAVKQVDTLLGMGCLDRRLIHLIGQVDTLVEDPNIVDQLKDSEVQKLRQLMPRLKEKVGELTTFGVPQTLVHGDLHLGNVVTRDGSYLFFDWTDGCVTHPFFDMMGIYNQKDEDLRSQFQNAYLEVWTEFESMDRLQRCWKLAGSLYYLHHAISYQHITANLEAINQPELDAAPKFLRDLLNHEDWC